MEVVNDLLPEQPVVEGIVLDYEASNLNLQQSSA